MNPDETNPTTNTGATGGSNAGSVVPPALDFTSSETTSLSMADSLASAADNLTSAGMAAKEPDNGSIEMNEIGASNPSAQMERPDEPLVPAAPVPGSIGSVTSGPAVVTHDDATVTSAGGAAAAKPFGGTGTPTTGFTGTPTGFAGASGHSGSMASGAPSATGLGGAATSSFGTTAGSGFGTSTGASGSAMGASLTGFGGTANAGTSPSGAAGMGMSGASTGTSAASMGNAGASMPGVSGTGAAAGVGATGAGVAKEPYNPFAARMGAASGNTQTSSMNVPAGSQPATEKFSTKLPGLSAAKKPAMLTVILGILAAVSLVMAVVFAVLWQNAEANKKVVYEPSTPDEGGINQTVAMMTCTKNLGPDEAEIMPGLVDHNAAATVNFANDQLGSIKMLNKYVFADAAAAEAMRTYFDGTVVWYGSVAEASGVTAGPASLDIADVTATLSLSTESDQLAGEYIALFGLTAGEDGKVDTSREAIQANYAANGFTCVED